MLLREAMKILPFVLLTILLCQAEQDLYSVLGVRKRATEQEIKKAYKSLAKEMHPDKNLNDPQANEKFMKINEAYETLSDPEKRRQYDDYGTTSANSGQEQHHGFHGGFQGHPFNSFFSPFGGFEFSNRGSENLQKFRLTMRNYESRVVPESHEKPYIIFVYTDFCFACRRMEALWDRFVQDLETIGLGIGTLNANHDMGLTNALYITNVPRIVSVVRGRVRQFSGDDSLHGLRQFVRSLLEVSPVQRVTDASLSTFLSGWEDNRVRVLFTDRKPLPSLRFLAAVFAHRRRIVAGYADVSGSDVLKLVNAYRIDQYTETLMVFAEHSTNPVARVAEQEISRSAIDQQIIAHKYQVLPRLSSQSVFNELCPPNGSVRRKIICVLLLSTVAAHAQPQVQAFRQYAKSHKDVNNRVHYAYVWQDYQPQFVGLLTQGRGAFNSSSGAFKVAVAWRQDNNHVNYEWLEGGWVGTEASAGPLEELVDEVLASRDLLSLVITLPTDLADEDAEPLLKRIWIRLKDWMDIAYYKIIAFDVVALGTLVMTVIVAIAFALMMRTLAKGDEPDFRRRQQQRPPTHGADGDSNGTASREPPVVNIHPLSSLNFRQVVMDVEPGTRVIVLLLTQPFHERLIQKFAYVMAPYARSNGFRFALLQLEQHLAWYRALLAETLGDDDDRLSSINATNCVGTVLALNGPRKYYCMYQPMKQRRQDFAGFLGFGADEDEDSDVDTGANGPVSPADGDRLLESDLLEGLSSWMDSLYEGSLKRFRISKWPVM